MLRDGNFVLMSDVFLMGQPHERRDQPCLTVWINDRDVNVKVCWF